MEGFRRRRAGVLIVVTVVLFLGAGLYYIRSMMQVADTTFPELEATPQGEQVEFLARIVTVNEAELTVEVAEALSMEEARLTGETLQVTGHREAPVVMGKPADVQPGAVVQVEGEKRDDGVVAAGRIVILTGYVRVR